ncbi:MAG: NAD(P)/FAD-dependent oxidoreductase [Lachnospiraceae bacterium]
MRTIIIIGAGPAGMMAAIIAKRNGAKVILLERNSRVGKKILSTGNGRCNFSNTVQEPFLYHSEDKQFPWKVYEQFDVHQTLRFFTELGIYSRNRGGYLYPYSDQAAAVLEVLQLELQRLDIAVELEADIKRVKKQGEQFFVKTKGADYQADRLIIATGSKATPKTGSDGSGYTYAKQFGHTIIPVVPALVQLHCADKEYRELAGIRTQGKATLYLDEHYQAEDTGEIQLTKYGISGIPVFQVSRFASKGIADGRKVTVVLDFMPDFSDLQFLGFLKNRVEFNSNKTMDTFFIGVFHHKLARVFLKKAEISPKKQTGQLSVSELNRLCEIVKHYSAKITDTNSFEQAQVCAGGVSTTQLNPQNLESTIVSGLHFAGEILDVDGACGGYNLQWAWSSGFVAGKGAASEEAY